MEEEKEREYTIIPNGLDFQFGVKSKSQSRSIMESMYGQAFINGVDAEYDVMLLDALQIIKNVGNGACDPAITDGKGIKMTGKELVISLKQAAEYYLTNTNCAVYVMLFDKIEKVPLSKGETQVSRDDSKKAYTKEVDMFDETEDKDNEKLVDEYIEEEEVQSGTLEMEICTTAKKAKKVKNYQPTDNISYKDRRPYLTLDALLPNDWTIAMTDRDNTARHIISWLSYQMFFSEDPDCRIDVPLGKIFMIDGHCLQDEMVGKIKERDQFTYASLISKLNGDADQKKHLLANLNFMPIVKTVREPTFDPEYIPPHEDIYFDQELYNEHGEGDFGFFYYIKNLARFSGLNKFAIYSIDTDTLYNSLWRYEFYFKGPKGELRGPNGLKRLFWKYGPNPSWALFVKNPRCVNSKLVDIDVLYLLIHGRKTDSLDHHFINYDEQFKKNQPTPKKTDQVAVRKEEKPKKKKSDAIDWHKISYSITKMKNPVKNLVACILAGGSDYTKGYNSITYEKFIVALARHHEFIGEIIEVINENEFRFKGDAYSRLIMCAYMYSKEKRFQDDGKKNEKEQKASGFGIITPDLYPYSEIVKKTKTLAKKNHPPSPNFVSSSALHLYYYLSMLNQLGNYAIVEPDLKVFGFFLKDETGGWKRKNVQKMFKIDPDRMGF